MPFVDIRLAGSATRDQKSALVADITRALGEHLGKPASAVQINLTELSTENYGSGGILIADRNTPSRQEGAAADVGP